MKLKGLKNALVQIPDPNDPTGCRMVWAVRVTRAGGDSGPLVPTYIPRADGKCDVEWALRIFDGSVHPTPPPQPPPTGGDEPITTLPVIAWTFDQPVEPVFENQMPQYDEANAYDRLAFSWMAGQPSPVHIVPGKIGKALETTINIDGQFLMPEKSRRDPRADPPLLNPVAFAGWFKYKQVGGSFEAYIYGPTEHGGGWGQTFQFYENRNAPGKIGLQDYTDPNAEEYDSTPYPAGSCGGDTEWHLYVFGVKADGRPYWSIDGMPAVVSSRAMVFYEGAGGFEFPGMSSIGSFDESGVWEAELTDGNIKWLWNNGAGRSLRDIAGFPATPPVVTPLHGVINGTDLYIDIDAAQTATGINFKDGQKHLVTFVDIYPLTQGHSGEPTKIKSDATSTREDGPHFLGHNPVIYLWSDLQNVFRYKQVAVLQWRGGQWVAGMHGVDTL